VLLDEFVLRFNMFSEEHPDMRKQDLTKDELHQQVDDLHEKLKEKVNTRTEQCTSLLQEMEESQWVESQVEVVAAQTQHAVQLEARRYYAACQLISDFYWSAIGDGLPAGKTLPPLIDVLGDADDEPVAEDPKAKAKAKAKAKGEEEAPEDPAAVRAAKLRKRVEATEEVPAHLEFPFIVDLIKKAKDWCWKVEEYQSPNEEKEPEVDPKAKAKAKAKAKGAADEPEKPAQPASALYVDMQQALIAERMAYCHRLAMINSWAEKLLISMTEKADDMYLRHRDWVALRRQKELDCVAGLADILKEHIENEDLITARLTLEGSHLHQHPNLLLKAPTPPVKPPPVESNAPFRWSIEQLDGLLDVLRGAASAVRPGSQELPVNVLLHLLVRLTQPSGDDDSKARQQAQVPESWRSAEVERLHSLCCLFDHPPRCGTVDCVEFLTHVGLLHSPQGWPSLDSLLKVRACLESMVPPGCFFPDFWITAAQFESLPLFDDEDGLELAHARKYATAAAVAPAVFDRATAQKRWLGRVLRSFPAPLRQQQAYDLELAWYNYQVQLSNERQRHTTLFDDSPASANVTPHDGADAMTSLALASSALEPESPTQDKKGRDRKNGIPLPPPPEMPPNLPVECEDSISVRQLLTYFCQGKNVEEGMERALTVLAPGALKGAAADRAVAPEDFHAALFQLGVRPTPPSYEGDGQPQHPSVMQFYEKLGLFSAAELSSLGLSREYLIGNLPEMSIRAFTDHERSALLMTRLGLGRRHCQQPVSKLFPA